MAEDFLGLLEDISSVAGVSFISAATPFVGPLRRGVNLLFGGAADTTLEIGLARAYEELETEHFAVMRTPAGTVTLSELELGKDFRLLRPGGKVISEYPYFVFSVDASRERDAWFEIPELNQAHADLRATVRTGRRAEAKEQFEFFRRVTLTSPDLLEDDAQRIVDFELRRVDRALGATTTSGRNEVDRDIGELSELRIYDA